MIVSGRLALILVPHAVAVCPPCEGGLRGLPGRAPAAIRRARSPQNPLVLPLRKGET
jgi:hypothetical protein